MCTCIIETKNNEKTEYDSIVALLLLFRSLVNLRLLDCRDQTVVKIVKIKKNEEVNIWSTIIIQNN